MSDRTRQRTAESSGERKVLAIGLAKPLSRLFWATLSVLISLAFVMVLTYMSFAANDKVENTMTIGRQSVAVTEEYLPPQPLYPGDEVRKVVSFTNDGETASLIRVRYDEVWREKSGTVLSNEVQVGDAEVPVTIKNWSAEGFPNTSLWTDGGDGYFYYNKVLQPMFSTRPVLNSMIFNETVLQSSALLHYTDAEYQLSFFVESVASAVSASRLKDHFGSHVSAVVGEDGTVAWLFT